MNRNRRRSLTTKFKKFAKSVWGIISGIIILLAGVGTCYQLKDARKTPHEKSQEKIDSGILKPLEIPFSYTDINQSETQNQRIRLDSIFLIKPAKQDLPPIKGIFIKDFKNSIVSLICGNKSLMPVGELLDKKELNVFDYLYSDSETCKNQRLLFTVRDDRLYVSAELQDLKENIVCSIEYNHWKVFYDDKVIYNYSDSTLEVRDRQHHVLLSISLNYIPRLAVAEIKICGYFLGPSNIGVLVLSDSPATGVATCFSKSDPNWKEKAEIEIQRIKPRYTSYQLPK